MEGSKDTHHTSPLRGYIPDQPLAPLFCFAFAIRIICHFTILRNQTVWGLFGGGARSLFDLSCGIFIHTNQVACPRETGFPNGCSSLPFQRVATTSSLSHKMRATLIRFSPGSWMTSRTPPTRFLGDKTCSGRTYDMRHSSMP